LYAAKHFASFFAQFGSRLAGWSTVEQRSKRNAERWATEVDKAHGRAASPFELSWWTETVLVALTVREGRLVAFRMRISGRNISAEIGSPFW
jgi:hypothetical protein